jgi:4-hydroxy-tetrahydrodipicolinate synthase
VVAAIAEHYGLAARSSLPLPLRGLDDAARAETIAVTESLGLRRG